MMQLDLVMIYLPFGEDGEASFSLVIGAHPSQGSDGGVCPSASFSLCHHYTIRNVHIAITICKQKENKHEKQSENGSKYGTETDLMRHFTIK
jgi:hypothetical protein